MRRHVRLAPTLVVAALVLVPAGVANAAPAGTAVRAATTTCAATPIVVNTGGSSADALVTYRTDGTRISSVPAARDYGDIALTSDGTLYSISLSSAPATLATISQSSGAEIRTVTVTGAAAGVESFNALSAAPNGLLFAAADGATTIYTINPSTGASQQYATFPAGFTSGGDFLTLPGGDLLAVTADPRNSARSALVRVRSGVSTQVGTVPSTFGAAQSGGAVYLAGADGVLRSLASVPTTRSTAALSPKTVVSTGLPLYGATALADSGICPHPSQGKLRVLVTGFNDWDDLGSPPNVWKCSVNPTCRLLLGAATNTEPTTLAGPLVQALTAQNTTIAWTFQTLPVDYGVFDIDVTTGRYDVVVDLGLGVYDTTTAIQYELGAKNFDSGDADASGATPDAPINRTGSDLSEPAAQAAKINAAVAGGSLPGGFTPRTHQNPDDGNTFVCNDTHYRALAAVASGRLAAAYFIHLPYPAHTDDYGALAGATAAAILRLVG